MIVYYALIAFLDLYAILDLSFLKIHYLDLHADLLLSIVIPRNVFILLAMDETLLDGLQTEDADQHTQSVIEDVSDEIP